MAVPNFSFNGQQSYSPLLSALAEAPIKRAQLQIQQEQNKRQRLSDLLTNLSNVATINRNIRQAQGSVDLARLAGKQSPVAGAAAQAAPDAYATGVANVTAPFQGLDAMMGPPAAPLAGEGVTPGDSGIRPQSDALMERKMAIADKIFPPQNELNADPFGLQRVTSKVTGKSRPVDNSADFSTDLNLDAGPKPGVRYAPAIQKMYDTRQEKLTKLADDIESAKPMQSVREGVQAVDQLRGLISGNIPASAVDTGGLITRLGGITRVTETELRLNGGNPGLVPRFMQAVKKASGNGWTAENQKELTAMADVIEQTLARAGKRYADSYVTAAREPMKQYGGAIDRTVYPKIADVTSRIDPKFDFKDPMKLKSPAKNGTNGLTPAEYQEFLKLHKRFGDKP